MISRPSRSRTTWKLTSSPLTVRLVMGVSVPARKREVPVSWSPSRFSLSRGVATPPSGMVNVHFQVPSSEGALVGSWPSAGACKAVINARAKPQTAFGNRFFIRFLPAGGLLRSIHQDFETARNNFRALPGRAGRFFVFGRGQINFVRLRIQRHRPRAALGGEGLHHRQFLRVVFMRDRDRPFAIGAESQLAPGIKRVGIDSLADRHR